MTSPDPSLLSLNTATVRAQWTMPEIIDGCVRHGIGRIAPWRDQVAAAGLAETAQRVRDAGLALSGYCRGGMFPAPDAAGRRAAREDNRRAVDEALALGAPCLVLVVGGLPKDEAERPASKDLAGARAMVRDGIAELLEYARPAGHAARHRAAAPDVRGRPRVRQHARPGQRPLRRARTRRRRDRRHLPRVVGPLAGARDRPRRPRGGGAGLPRLMGFHLCDWLVPTTDLLLDRGMMGDGVIDIPLIRSWMERAGYRGPHEVEIFSARDWWQRDPDEVLATCKARHASAC